MLAGAFVLTPPAAGGAEPAFAERLEELLPRLADPGRVAEADTLLEKLCLEAARPGAEAERRAAAAALAGKLDPERPPEVLLLLLRELQVIGRWEIVARVERLLAHSDARVAEAARRALEANPAPQALRALRKAYQEAQGPARAALILSLGMRKDSLAVGELLDDALSADRMIKLAALEALARIGDRQAVELFEKELAAGGPDRTRIRALYFRLAESMAEGEEGGAARRIYLRALQLGRAERCTALLGLGRTGLPADAKALLEALSDPDREVRAAAREGLGYLRGGVKPIAAKLEGASGEARLDLWRALLSRRDAEAAPWIQKAAKDADPAVRRAAFEAFGRRGGPGAVEALAAGAGDADPSAAEAAQEALANLPGDGATAEIAAAIPTAPPPSRAVLLRALVRRVLVQGAPAQSSRTVALAALRSAVKDADPAVRAEAFRGLGILEDADSMPALLEAVAREDGPARLAAAGALARLRSPEADAAVLKALASLPPGAGAAPGERAALLLALGGRAGAPVLEALARGAKDDDPGVRRAALQALAMCEDEAALPLLALAAAAGDAEAQRIALRASLRFADSKSRSPDAEVRKSALALYLRALDEARDDEDRRRALRGIAELGGPETLGKLRPLFTSPALRREAGRAAVRLAARLPAERKAEAIEIFQEILRADPDRATARESVRHLRRLGITIDPARSQGMVTSWWLLGPLPAGGQEFLKTPLPPETEVSLEKEVRIGGEVYRWKPHRPEDPRGVVDLGEALPGLEAAGAYLYAEITVGDASEALLKMGSDDEIACFLNGVKVHASAAGRGLTIDEDLVKVKLEKGLNRLLLKVVNQSGGWEACLRITDLQGKPLPFEQREA